MENQCFLIFGEGNVTQKTFLPNAYKDERKTDQNCSLVRRTKSVPICIAVNDKLEC